MSRLVPGEILHGRDMEGFDERADAVVVGSGAGGAVAATLLAEAGMRVVVLEEGPHYRPDEIANFLPTEAMRKMWREAGMLAAFGVGETPVIAVTVGRNVGGSSVHTGGVCFRIPSEVHATWARDLGLPELAEARLAAAYADVERRAHIAVVPEAMRSRSTDKFVEGAGRLGIPMTPLRRNTEGCEGNALCNFGCPKLAKKSVDLSYLPDALAHGATVVSDALVERVLFDGQRAIGVEGRLVPPRGTRQKGRVNGFRVRAPLVVAACGTLHTPLLLHASGVRGPHLGRHVTVHPSTRLMARFDDRIDGWNGALQSVYSDHFAASDGITIVGVYTPVNLLAAGFPGAGPTHRERVEQLPYMAVCGALVHDEGGGVVRPSPVGREGVLSYEMAPRDLVRLRHGMTLLGEIAFAGGAREVYVPVFGTGAIRSVDELRRLEQDRIDPHRIESVAFHPLGSARMANTPAGGVTRPTGEVYGTRGLYVADGSVLPTSIGVNSQEPIMTMATRIAWGLAEQYAPRRRRQAEVRA